MKTLTQNLIMQSKQFGALVTVTGIYIAFAQSCQSPDNSVGIDFNATDSIGIFADGVISTRYNERDFTLSPENDLLLYTMQHRQTGFSVILECKKINNGWTKPEVASFSGNYSDLEPFFSPDGKKLYFASNRPTQSDSIKKDMDIWYVDINENGWGDPVNVGSPVNSTRNEFYPAVTSNGNLYFTGEREGGVGKEDIFISRFKDGQYMEPVALDTGVNSAMYEFNAFVSPAEEYILFSSFGRKDDLGGGDLYISFADSAGGWQQAMNLGERVNSTYLEYCPFVTSDRKFLFFTSNRTDVNHFSNKNLNHEKFIRLLDSTVNGNDNIYIVTFDVIETLKGRHDHRK